MRVVLVYVNNELNIARGAGYVAGAILEAGHEVSFFDSAYIPIETLVDWIVAGNYDILMLSSMTMIFPVAIQLARLTKQKSNIPILLGGIHATIAGGKILSDYPEFDYLCIGEGEKMVVHFLENFGKNSLFDIPNLAYRREDGTIQVNRVAAVQALGNLPQFPWHLFPKESVVEPTAGFIYVHASRGCPYNCPYCGNGVYLRLYGKNYLRYRPIESIIRELKELEAAYNPKIFYFGDEMILFDPEYAISLFRRIRNEVGIPYGCMARVEYLKPEIVQAMAETGCQYLGLGVDCGDEEFRYKQLNRKMTNEEIGNTFRSVKESGIYVTSFNMIGFPFDNDDKLAEATLALNQKINPDWVQLTIFYPLLGTQLYDYCIEQDLVDFKKMFSIKDYHEESPLKGISLCSKRKKMGKLLNLGKKAFQAKPLPPLNNDSSQISTADSTSERTLEQKYVELQNHYESQLKQHSSLKREYQNILTLLYKQTRFWNIVKIIRQSVQEKIFGVKKK